MHRIYRAKILFALDKNLEDELAWLNEVALNNLKNYQIWYIPYHPMLSQRRKETNTPTQASPPSVNVFPNALPIAAAQGT